MFARRIQVHTHAVHAVFDDLIKSLFQFRLINIVLILPHANRFWINFNQFSEGVAQAATDRNGSSDGNIVFGELFRAIFDAE